MLLIVVLGLFALFFPVLGHPAAVCDRSRAWPAARGGGPEGLTVFLVAVISAEMLRRGLKELDRWEDRLYVALLCGGFTFGVCAW